MTLYLAFVRHGDYDQRKDCPSALQPFPLSSSGKQQAREAAMMLKKCCDELGLDIAPVIDSSNLCRGWQTADIISSMLGPSFETCGFDALAERSVGSAANLTVTEIVNVLDQDPRFECPPANWKSDSFYCLPLQGAESLMDAGYRVAEHVKQRSRLTDITDSLKVFVGHGAAFRHAAHILGALEFEEIAGLSMFHGRPVVFQSQTDNSDFTIKKVWGEWKVRKPREEFLD